MEKLQMNEIGFLLRALLETFAPLGIFLYLFRKHGGRIQPYFAGIIALMAIALPRKGLFALMIPKEEEWAIQIVISILIGAFCEEIARYIAMKYFLTEYDTVIDAVCYGLGHGGMEMLALSQYPWEFFLASMGMISENSERMQMISEISFLENIEILFADDCMAILLHIACSVLIHVAVRYGEKKYFWISVLLHAANNVFTIYFDVTGSVLGTAMLCYLTYKIYYQNKGAVKL
jgi:uncharacterized membrane protein YhfC